MNVVKHIVDLLYLHDCVVLPELGAFVVNPESTVIDHVMGQIHPPGRKLSFNTLIKSNDGLLIDYVARKEHCSYETANNWVSEFVQEVLAKVTAERIYQMEGIGSFSLNPEQKINFLPEGHNFALEAYGLPVLNYYPILRGSYNAAKAIPTTSRTPKSLSVNFTLLNKVAAIALLLVIVPLLLWQLGKIGSNHSSANQAGFMNSKPESTVENEGVPQEKPTSEEAPSQMVAEQSNPQEPEIRNDRPHDGQLDIDEDEADNSPALVSRPQAELKPIENKVMVDKYLENERTEEVFIVIIGSFGNTANAKSLTQKLIKDGYTPYSDSHKGLKRVGIRLLCPAAELDKQLLKIRGKYNPKAWVFDQ